MIDNWNLTFISRDVFKKHLKETVMSYLASTEAIDLEKFNNNIIDPIKLTFDSLVYAKSLETIIREEISRQRDKTNNNAIGYFHQNIFKYLNFCSVPLQGFDVIVNLPHKKIQVEMKNKHNTMNSSSSAKTYIKMHNYLIDNPDSYCYLVEIISQKSQNTTWCPTIDGIKYNDSRIRRVSIDHFLMEVTGDKYAFRKICDQLPVVLKEVMSENRIVKIPEDSVLAELREINKEVKKALFELAFKDYIGFRGI